MAERALYTNRDAPSSALSFFVEHGSGCSKAQLASPFFTIRYLADLPI